MLSLPTDSGASRLTVMVLLGMLGAAWKPIHLVWRGACCRLTARCEFVRPGAADCVGPLYKKQDHYMTYDILIADDHPLFRSALHQALTIGLGPAARLVEAESIAQLESRLAEKADWDLVLLDLNMPGAYGFSGLVLLRGQYPQIPVVMVSAQEEASIVVRSREFGASGFIPKSSSLEVIQQAVRTVLDGDVWWPPQVNEVISVSDEAKAASAGLASLTPQQFRVLTMVCEGLLNKQIASELSVSEATIKAHVTAIFRKLGVRTRTQAALLLQQLESISSH
ncbi:LuxR response regulator receiver [Pseudomonas syringae pv. philadelphi]|uniref:LuxR response regulator receiver n=1 Tax=Pseudomonas syringae pv. philadelphi TaxID=251706 RepID=A0A3M3YEV1_9PSED|nr:LuxR response regulator receiver [Pseudomonas syringae pv. philadelphi]